MKKSKAVIKIEPQTFEFRKNEFEIFYHYYEENDTSETYTTTELDELNINQVHNQYRQKYGIPFPDEIKIIREQYGLSAVKMSKLLGFGSNQYRLYEEGEIPSVSNGKMIESLKDPVFFKELFERSINDFTESEALRIRKKAEELISLKSAPETQCYHFVFKGHSPYRNNTNGYMSINHEKIKQTILFFATQLTKIFETKLNKLLFYSDFLHYKSYGKGITGLQYQAITYGPVPLNYATIYENLNGLRKDIIDFDNGYFGSVIIAKESFDDSLFNEKELSILQIVVDKFRNVNASKISEMSHSEKAWIKNKDDHGIIDYNDAFFLKNI